MGGCCQGIKCGHAAIAPTHVRPCRLLWLTTTLLCLDSSTCTHPSASSRGTALTSFQWWAGEGWELGMKLRSWPGRVCSLWITHPRLPGEWHSVASWLANSEPAMQVDARGTPLAGM